MPDVELTWLGHASFRVDSPGGKRLYVDPWLSNPKCPEGEKEPERVDVMALTHGHGDHIGDAADLGKKFSPKLVAIIELAGWLEGQGFPNASQLGFNKGGTIDVDGIKFTMTHAVHSSSFTVDGTPVYLGDPAGYVVEFENGTKIYFAGDTAAFSDMQIIGKYLEPDVAAEELSDINAVCLQHVREMLYDGAEELLADRGRYTARDLLNAAVYGAKAAGNRSFALGAR